MAPSRWHESGSVACFAAACSSPKRPPARKVTISPVATVTVASASVREPGSGPTSSRRVAMAPRKLAELWEVDEGLHIRVMVPSVGLPSSVGTLLQAEDEATVYVMGALKLVVDEWL